MKTYFEASGHRKGAPQIPLIVTLGRQWGVEEEASRLFVRGRLCIDILITIEEGGMGGGRLGQVNEEKLLETYAHNTNAHNVTMDIIESYKIFCGCLLDEKLDLRGKVPPKDERGS